MSRVRILEAVWFERPVTMRLPFQFGSTEVRETAEAFLSVTLEVDGRHALGRAAQLMVPRWFNKRADLSNADTIEELRATIRAAVARAPSQSGTAFGLSRALRADVAGDLPGTPALAAGFGPALVEMAVIDGLCRAVQVPFWRAARGDLFGIAEAAPADISAEAISQSLARIGPPKAITLRHTIGFDAPLRAASVGPDAPRDGQPVALEEVIARTGIRAFKIKLKGDPDADLARLRDIAKIVGDLPQITLTLDANEQFDPAPFGDFLAAYRADGALSDLHAATRFIEQPYPREIALETEVSADLPLVIDESDSAEGAFPRALELGWSGTSIKSCKGVLRALLNKARADAAGALLSGEDLTCQPGLCWQQDTAMMAACDVPDVERNGHHFAGGMQGALKEERRRFLEEHPDLYAVTDDRIGLRIDQGRVEIGSLNSVGFAGAEPDAPGHDATQTERTT